MLLVFCIIIYINVLKAFSMLKFFLWRKLCPGCDPLRRLRDEFWQSGWKVLSFFTDEILHGTAQGLSGGKHIAVPVLSGVGGSGAQPLSVRRPRGPACGVWGKSGLLPNELLLRGVRD